MWTISAIDKTEIITIPLPFGGAISLPKHDNEISERLKSCRLKQVYTREKIQKSLQQREV